MKTFLIGLILGLIAVPLGVYLYFSSGRAPVATAAPPMPLEKTLARMALHARMDVEMPKTAPPVSADEATYMAAVPIYKDNCAVCHGLPGQAQTAIAKGMFPKPPKLTEGTGVSDDPAGKTYWKISGGIRMTGMPGYEKTLLSTQMWQVSVLLANSDKWPKSVTDSLSGVMTAPMAASPDATKKK
jgi:thiosulfate dehydrogenase